MKTANVQFLRHWHRGEYANAVYTYRHLNLEAFAPGTLVLIQTPQGEEKGIVSVGRVVDAEAKYSEISRGLIIGAVDDARFNREKERYARKKRLAAYMEGYKKAAAQRRELDEIVTVFPEAAAEVQEYLGLSRLLGDTQAVADCFDR